MTTKIEYPVMYVFFLFGKRQLCLRFMKNIDSENVFGKRFLHEHFDIRDRAGRL